MRDDLTAREVLDRVKPELARQGHEPTGPYSSGQPGVEYLTLSDGRRVRAGGLTMPSLPDAITAKKRVAGRGSPLPATRRR